MPSRRALLFGVFSRTTAAPADQPPAAGPDAAVARVLAITADCLAERNVVCRSCGEQCPTAAIRFSPRLGGAALPAVLADRCTGCGDCLPVCPVGALQLTPAAVPTRTVEELAA